MASQNISFSQIPASIRKPGVYGEFNTKLAVRSLPANVHNMCIIAQKIAAGTIAALKPIQVFSASDAATYFGIGSIAHKMVQAAIAGNQYLNLTVCALDDAIGSAAAAGSIVIGGPATSSGSLTIYIGNQACEIAVANADTAATMATNLLAALAAIADLPVSYAIDGVNNAKINFTAKNKGSVGNQIGIDYDTDSAAQIGVTITISAMAAGAVDPDITTALAAIFASGHDLLAVQYIDQTSLTALATHLNTVSGPMEQRGARGVYAMTGTLAAATTLAGQINSERVNNPYLRGTRSTSYEVAACYCAVMASEEDPAMPLNTLPLTGIAAPQDDQRLSRAEQESCLWNGVAPLEVGAGENVQIVRAISTYTKNPAGVADPSLLDTTTIATLDYTRLAVNTRLMLRFPRSKLTDGVPKVKPPTKDIVRSQVIDVLKQEESLEILQDVTANVDGIEVERDTQDNSRLDIKIPAKVVNGLHIIAERIDLYL